SVSKARLDFPDPETPVTTVMALCGIVKSRFFRLWTRAPRTRISSISPGTVARTAATSVSGPRSAFASATLSVGFFGMRVNEKLYAVKSSAANEAISPRQRWASNSPVAPYLSFDENYRQFLRSSTLEFLQYTQAALRPTVSSDSTGINHCLFSLSRGGNSSNQPAPRPHPG